MSKCWHTGVVVEAGLFIWNPLAPVDWLVRPRTEESGVEASWPPALTKLAPEPPSDLTFPHHAIAVLSWSSPLASPLSPFTPWMQKSVLSLSDWAAHGPTLKRTFTHKLCRYSSKRFFVTSIPKGQISASLPRVHLEIDTDYLYTYLSLNPQTFMLPRPRARVSAVTGYKRGPLVGRPMQILEITIHYLQLCIISWMLVLQSQRDHRDLQSCPSVVWKCPAAITRLLVKRDL